MNKSMICNEIQELPEFENWIILEGKVKSAPVKAVEGDKIFYNFRIDNGKFRMNCTITQFKNNENDIEDEIFESLKEGIIAKVSGKLFIKKKEEKLWVQINVKNWITTNNGRKVKYKVT